MQILDRKLKKYFPNYIFQSLLATISLTIILYFENIFNCPGDSGLGLVLFHYTCYPYNHFPLISEQIFAKTMVKRFGLMVSIFFFFLYETRNTRYAVRIYSNLFVFNNILL